MNPLTPLRGSKRIGGVITAAVVVTGLIAVTSVPVEAYRYGQGYSFSNQRGYFGSGTGYGYGYSSPYIRSYSSPSYGYRGGYSNPAYSYPYLYNRPYTISTDHLHHYEYNTPGRFGMPPRMRYYNSLPPGVSPPAVRYR